MVNLIKRHCYIPTSNFHLTSLFVYVYTAEVRLNGWRQMLFNCRRFIFYRLCQQRLTLQNSKYRQSAERLKHWNYHSRSAIHLRRLFRNSENVIISRDPQQVRTLCVLNIRLVRRSGLVTLRCTVTMQKVFNSHNTNTEFIHSAGRTHDLYSGSIARKMLIKV